MERTKGPVHNRHAGQAQPSQLLETAQRRERRQSEVLVEPSIDRERLQVSETGQRIEGLQPRDDDQEELPEIAERLNAFQSLQLGNAADRERLETRKPREALQ